MFLNDMGLLMFLAVTASLLGYCQTDEKGKDDERNTGSAFRVAARAGGLAKQGGGRGVSFYGASYIHLPVQEAKGATDISFRFRTHLADAMLLLAAGKTDYCLIKLEAGRLKAGRENRANLISQRTKSERSLSLIKFVKKIVKKDENEINGGAKKCRDVPTEEKVGCFDGMQRA
ncbi:hypothetical protein KM043_004385 [Ampulex compressa]|nr:hypothetical protein KM043_004385 [Ampulex compressa]